MRGAGKLFILVPLIRLVLRMLQKGGRRRGRW